MSVSLRRHASEALKLTPFGPRSAGPWPNVFTSPGHLAGNPMRPQTAQRKKDTALQPNQQPTHPTDFLIRQPFHPQYRIFPTIVTLIIPLLPLQPDTATACQHISADEVASRQSPAAGSTLLNSKLTILTSVWSSLKNSSRAPRFLTMCPFSK